MEKLILKLFGLDTMDGFRQFHTNLSELFTKPIKTWKRTIKYGKNSYDFYLQVILYYILFVSLLLVLFLSKNWLYVFPITIAELAFTFIPFGYLYLPFKFFTKHWNKRIQSNRLFRLLFVIKLQVVLPYIAIVLLARWTKMESLYVIIDNYLIFILIIFLISLPLTLHLKFIQKVIWILANYIFSLIGFVIIIGIFSLIPHNELLVNKLAPRTPTMEHLNFGMTYNLSDEILNADYFIINVSPHEKHYHIDNTPFATSPLIIDLLLIKNKNLKAKVAYLESIEKVMKGSSGNLNEKKSTQSILSRSYMQDYREYFNKNFKADLNLTDSLRENALFKSNKTYYNLLNKYFHLYDSIYSSENFTQKLLDSEPMNTIEAERNKFVLIYEFKNPKIIELKLNINSIKKELELRENRSMFLRNIYFYPIEWIIDLLYFEDDFHSDSNT
jgi:hypothetical protein